MGARSQGRYLPPEPVGEEAGDGEEGPANGDMEADPEVEGAPDEATEAEEAPIIRINVTVVDLNDEQKAHFGDTIEFWDNEQSKLYQEPNPEGVDPAHISEAIRAANDVAFLGSSRHAAWTLQNHAFFTAKECRFERLPSLERRY